MKKKSRIRSGRVKIGASSGEQSAPSWSTNAFWTRKLPPPPRRRRQEPKIKETKAEKWIAKFDRTLLQMSSLFVETTLAMQNSLVCSQSVLFTCGWTACSLAIFVHLLDDEPVLAHQFEQRHHRKFIGKWGVDLIGLGINVATPAQFFTGLVNATTQLYDGTDFTHLSTAKQKTICPITYPRTGLQHLLNVDKRKICDYIYCSYTPMIPAATAAAAATSTSTSTSTTTSSSTTPPGVVLVREEPDITLQEGVNLVMFIYMYGDRIVTSHFSVVYAEGPSVLLADSWNAHPSKESGKSYKRSLTLRTYTRDNMETALAVMNEKDDMTPHPQISSDLLTRKIDVMTTIFMGPKFSEVFKDTADAHHLDYTYGNYRATIVKQSVLQLAIEKGFSNLDSLLYGGGHHI